MAFWRTRWTSATCLFEAGSGLGFLGRCAGMQIPKSPFDPRRGPWLVTSTTLCALCIACHAGGAIFWFRERKRVRADSPVRDS